MKKIFFFITLILIFSSTQSLAKTKAELWPCVQNMACDINTKVPTSDIKEIKASSTLKDKQGLDKSYNVKNLLDESESTAWCEGVKGDGKSQKVSIEFKKPTTIAGILVSTGYAKSKNTFLNNNRVKKFTIKLDTDCFPFEVKRYFYNWATNQDNDIKDPRTDMLSPQIITLDKPVTVKHAEFIIESVISGKKYNDTCIGTLTFIKNFDNEY